MFESRQSLHDDVEVIFSTKADGSVAAGGGQPSDSAHQKNADNFLARHDFPSLRYRVLVEYRDDATYTEVVRIESGTEPGDMPSDALYTTLPNVTITLPVADCVATVVYDPVTKLLGVLHLGRHSSVAGLIESFVIDVADNVGSDPRDWLVWMSPSLRKVSDRLDYFSHSETEEWRQFVDIRPEGVYIDVVGHNLARFTRAGVAADNISVSPIDTYQDERFFSHRAAHQLDLPDRQGRMMVAARRPA